MKNIKERPEFENYTKIKLLGEGSFGKAYLITRNSDGLQCVMKQIDIGRMSEKEKREVLQESRLLEALHHPNIVQFIEVYKTKKGKLCIIMDFADGGDLGGKVKDQRGKNFSEAQILDWFTQICLGMKHTHDRKIIHRDLKGGNVFLTKKGIIQIGDFGIAKVLAQTMAKAKTCIGTPYYLSPEVVQSQPYSLPTDVWSMGVMLYELCALKPPFDATSIHLLSMKIVRGVYNPAPAMYSQGMHTLIKECLNINAARRPTVSQILKMPMIQDRIKTYLTQSIFQNEFSHTVLHKQNVFEMQKPIRQPPPEESYITQPRAPPTPPPVAAKPATPAAPILSKEELLRQANACKYMAGQKGAPAGGNRNYIPYGQAAQQAQAQNQARAASPSPAAQPQADKARRDQEIAQRQRDEAEGAQRKRMDQINQKIREKEAELNRIAKQKAEKDRQMNDQRRIEQAQREKADRQRALQAEEQRRIQQWEEQEARVDNKKFEEQRKLKELEDARKQAYNDRVAIQQRVQNEKNAQDRQVRDQYAAQDRDRERERARDDGYRGQDPKKVEEQRKLKELEDIRRQAYNDRKAIANRVQNDKDEEARQRDVEKQSYFKNRDDPPEQRERVRTPQSAPRPSPAEAKKLEEAKKLKELQDARIQAYQDKKEMLARAQARANEKDLDRQQTDTEQAERAKQLADITDQKQKDAIKAKQLHENKKREEDERRKKAMDIERAKWVAEQQQNKEEKDKIKQEARSKAQLELEKIRMDRIRIQQEQQQKKADEQLAVYESGKRPSTSQPQQEPKKAPQPLNTIQRITRDVQSNIENIVQKGMGRQKSSQDQDAAPVQQHKPEPVVQEETKEPEQTAAQKLKVQRDEERKQFRAEMEKRAGKLQNQRPSTANSVVEKSKSPKKPPTPKKAEVKHPTPKKTEVKHPTPKKTEVKPPKPVEVVKPQTPARADKLQTPAKLMPKVMAPAFEIVKPTARAASIPVDSQETMKESTHDDSFETFLELEELKRSKAEEEAKIVDEEFDFQLDREIKDPMRETDEIVAKDPSYIMYKEMLKLVRNESDKESYKSGSPDPSYIMYKEMLKLVRNESDIDSKSVVSSRTAPHTDDNFSQVISEVNNEEDPRDNDRDDSDDDDALINNELELQKNKFSDFTFMADQQNMQNEFMSRMHSIEHVREYLEGEIGEELLMKVYPRLLDVGDDVFLEENTEMLCIMLKDLLSEEMVKKYMAFFATLIFFEKQSEANGGGETGESGANTTLKNLSEMTAAFGPKGMGAMASIKTPAFGQKR